MKTGIKVCDVMTFKPVTVSPSKSLRECALLMEEHHVGSLLVKEGSKLLGIVTEQDFVRKGVGKLDQPEKHPVRSIMAEGIVRVGPEEDVADALRTMNDYNIRHVPVMDGEKLVGFITAKDILKIQPHLFETLAESIELREQERKLRCAEPK